MKSPLMGYLGSVFIFIAALLMFASKNYVTGGILLFVAIVGLWLKLMMNQRGKKN